MYGGLFGDLPPTKKSKQSADDEVPSSVAGSANSSTTNSLQTSTLSQTAAAVPTASKKKNVASMAFIPTAARQRNKKRSTAEHPASSSGSLLPPSSLGLSARDTAERNASSSIAIATIGKLELPQNQFEFDIQTPIRQEESEPFEVESAELPADEIVEDVKDPYDPFVPNDLLEYWERKAARAQRELLEREQRERLLEQERLRQQLEQEKMELQKKGDLDKLIEHQSARSMGPRGRGRGVSNLPAWLVEKQRKEREGAA